ncbi:hypothetical protein NKF26_11965 [Haladaptatus sp. AB618]|uniref:hypothetical protein n=1 Tax=Haladaptatus sp. AB618 TaxID=2934173 RepID=UPI00209C185E|nr:hypothetical protein [Haladaptatus sp. AB618]MCO8254518.1 hypothetical protein [Haladaptatus sp. AB618]
MKRGEKISLILAVLFTVIPAIVTFYLPIFKNILGWVPFDFILPWMMRGGILTLVFTLGWSLRGFVETPDAERVDSIEGCIQKDDIAWKGIADISEGHIVDFDLPFHPICPECQTPLKKDTFEPPVQQSRRSPGYSRSGPAKRIWVCSNDNCSHTAHRKGGIHEDAGNLFESHIKKIVESEGEEYSLDSLMARINGKVTPRSVWEEYAEIVDDEQVSTNCFH